MKEKILTLKVIEIEKIVQPLLDKGWSVKMIVAQTVATGSSYSNTGEMVIVLTY